MAAQALRRVGIGRRVVGRPARARQEPINGSPAGGVGHADSDSPAPRTSVLAELPGLAGAHVVAP